MCKEYINLQTKEVLDLERVTTLPDNAMLKVKSDLWIEWDFEKNDELGFDIWKVTKGIGKKVWWICRDCDSSYDSSVDRKTLKNASCSYCAGRKVNHTNSLAVKNPKLASEWHPTKNGDSTPHDVTRSIAKKVWWLGKCGHEWEASINHRNNGKSCPYCSGHKTLKGYNDLNTTHPYIANLLLNKEDGDKYSYGSESKVDWKCPKCNMIAKNKRITDIVKRGYSCSFCNDGFRYPEKVMCALLIQLDIEFEYQKIFNWSNTRRYDFYIHSNKKDNQSYIIETHGEQHYKQATGVYGKNKTLSKEQENDKYKYDIAINNGIDNYIIIDCRNSEFEYVKNSIINSGMIEALVDGNIMVDWESIFINASSSKLIDACEIYSLGNKTTGDIAKQLGISITTVCRYLKEGTKIGLCSYNTSDYVKMESFKKQHKKIVQLNLNGMFVNFFNSIKEASENVHTHETSISACCRGKQKSAKGYKWMYLEEYEKINNKTS